MKSSLFLLAVLFTASTYASKKVISNLCNSESKCKGECISNAAECSGSGTLECGVCKCNPGNYGTYCECYAPGGYQTPNCKPDNSSTNDCSGRGSCVCGQCECEKRINPNEVITGQHCECDNFSCVRSSGLPCSGPDHGVCVCGECQCHSPWSGAACSCSSSNDTCNSPLNNKICSGKGECVCGNCECEMTGNGRYTGKFCEESFSDPGRCEEFKDCVQCLIYKTGPLPVEDCVSNCKFFSIIVPKVEAEKNERICVSVDEYDCVFKFVITYDENNRVIVKAQEKRECPVKFTIPFF